MTNTLLEVRHAIFVFFLQENVLCADEHFNMIQFECQDKALKIAMINSVLQDLEKIEMVKSMTLGDGKKYFVLTKPLTMYEQNVQLGYSTCLEVASIINSYCESINNTKDIVDASSIKERDIQKLILILDSLSSQK